MVTKKDSIQLRKFPLWDNLDERELDELLKIVRVRSYPSGTMLFGPGDEPNNMYFLYHGQVKTYTVSPRGQEKIMHIFSPGDAFGGLLMGVVNDNLPWALAMGDVVLCIMDEAGLKTFMQKCPNLCLNLFRYMREHHVYDTERLEQLLHTKAGYRVAFTLLYLGNQLGQAHLDEFHIHPFTQEDIGNMVGLIRSTVTEIISQFRRAGIVSGRGPKMLVQRAAVEQYLRDNE